MIIIVIVIFTISFFSFLKHDEQATGKQSLEELSYSIIAKHVRIDILKIDFLASRTGV